MSSNKHKIMITLIINQIAKLTMKITNKTKKHCKA